MVTPSKPQTAFVTGATGFTGREVVRQLRERGLRTIAHLRPGSGSARRWADIFRTWGAEVVEIPWEPEPMRAAIAEARPDLVFALIGTTRAQAKQEALAANDIYDAVDFRLSALLVDAVVAAGLRARFVYLSSMGANAASRNDYLAARGRAEEAIERSGLPFTIARPSVISGEGRDTPRPLEHAMSVAMNAILGVARRFGARRLHDRYRSIDNVALGRALTSAALDPASSAKVLLGEDLQRLAAAAD